MAAVTCEKAPRLQPGPPNCDHRMGGSLPVLHRHWQAAVHIPHAMAPASESRLRARRQAADGVSSAQSVLLVILWRRNYPRPGAAAAAATAAAASLRNDCANRDCDAIPNRDCAAIRVRVAATPGACPRPPSSGRPPPAARHAHARHLFGPPPPGAPLSAAAQTTPGGCRGPAPTRGVVSQLHSSAPPLGLERVSAASAARRPRRARHRPRSGTRDSLPSHRPLDRPGPRRASAARPDSLRLGSCPSEARVPTPRSLPEARVPSRACRLLPVRLPPPQHAVL